jgi:predicted nucleic acid-binding Zn ribbon protein
MNPEEARNHCKICGDPITEQDELDEEMCYDCIQERDEEEIHREIKDAFDRDQERADANGEL